MPVRADKLISVRLGHELEVGLVLVLEAHKVLLAQWQLPIWREAVALVALDVYSRVAPVVAEVELAGGALLAQPLAGVGVRCRLPGL